MNNNSSVTGRIAYTDKLSGSRLAKNQTKVHTITHLLRVEYQECRENPGHIFSLQVVLKEQMSPLLIAEFRKAAIKRRVLLDRGGSNVTYRVSKTDHVAEPNIMRTVSFLQETSQALRDKTEDRVMSHLSDEKLLKELSIRSL